MATIETGEFALEDFTISYWSRETAANVQVRVQASRGAITAFWSWRLTDRIDRETYFDTVVYPAIRSFVAQFDRSG